MPELPDVTVYVERIRERVLDLPLLAFRIASPFVLRSVQPPASTIVGKYVRDVTRMGKRIVLCFDDERYLVIHLMIAGRFRWKEPGAGIPAKVGLAALDFSAGSLLLTESSTKKRASIHVICGNDALRAFDRGGLEVDRMTQKSFRTVMTRVRHTLKRALTDPSILSGIGNSYSDEILHDAKLSPFRMTDRLTDSEWDRLFTSIRRVLADWTRQLLAEKGFPEKVTAFREGMAVHGRYGKPCPRCDTRVQRIVYAGNETNYCPTCQTEGRLLMDRSLSRLLREDWPKTLEDLEEHKNQLRQAAQLAGKGER